MNLRACACVVCLCLRLCTYVSWRVGLCGCVGSGLCVWGVCLSLFDP